MALRSFITLTVIVIGAAVLYRQTLTAPFVYEDQHVLRMAPASVTSTLFQSVPGRGLTTASLVATSRDPALAHLVNVLLHLQIGVLVAWLAWRLAGPVAMCGAALMQLWHPLNSQAVWYVTGRSDLQVTLGVVIALVAALSMDWWRWPLLAGGLWIAAASKEIGLIGVPLVVLTLACWRPQEFVRPWVGGLWIATGAVLGAAWGPVTTWAAMAPAAGGPDVAWTEFVVRQLGLTWSLFAKLVIPRGFSIDHDALTIGMPWLGMSVVATMAMVGVAVWAWTRCRILAWGVLFIMVALVPRLLIPTNEFIAERHLHLAMVGVSMLFGSSLAWWFEGTTRRTHNDALSRFTLAEEM